MNNKVKVLHVVDKFGVNGSSVTGVGRLFSWWIPRFDTSRYDVRLVGLRAHDTSAAQLAATGVAVDCLGKGKFEPSTAAALRKLVRDFVPDIVHLHGYGATNFGRLSTRGLPVRIVVHEHFVDPHMPMYQQIADYVLSPITDAAIAVSESVRQFMIAQRKLPEAKVEVIYNGAPLADFQPVAAERAAEERQRWGIPADARVIGTIGRLDEQKGLTYLLEAAALLCSTGLDVRYVNVGDGPLLEPLKRQAANYGIADRVIFTGYSSDTRALQTTFDVQAFPSLWEGTPLTVFEAMAMGKPIVSTYVDGLGEVLEEAATPCSFHLAIRSRCPSVFACCSRTTRRPRHSAGKRQRTAAATTSTRRSGRCRRSTSGCCRTSRPTRKPSRHNGERPRSARHA